MKLFSSRLAHNGSSAIVHTGLTRIALASVLALMVLVFALFFLGNETEALEERQVTAYSVFANYTAASTRASDGTINYPNCRFGAGERYNPVMSYNVSSLNLGWYVDWRTQIAPPHPGGAEYVQLLHVNGTSYSPSGSTLADRIAANPGSLWLIGNEPDCIHQDSVLPQDYAQAYHDAYTFIKEHDRMAKVAAGNIVQPTPLRMQYLDVVLDTYASLYGEPLPTDAWSIHTYILREERADPGYGCGVPPGLDVDAGELYNWWESDRLDIFQARILEFRHWMNQRGYRNLPLYITEYGSLMPYNGDPYVHDGDVFDEVRAAYFMTSTFDYLLSATDPDVGYPADENRLVQRWLWYSLDDNVNYGGALFDQYTQNPTMLGTVFGAYTEAMSPTVDLLAVDVGQVGSPPLSPVDAVTVVLRARVSNVGSVAITRPVTVRFLDGEEQQIGFDQVISGTVAGCAATREVTVTWPNVTAGAHRVQAFVDPEGKVSEENPSNNKVPGVVLVATAQVFLPLVTRGS